MINYNNVNDNINNYIKNNNENDIIDMFLKDIKEQNIILNIEHTKQKIDDFIKDYKQLFINFDFNHNNEKNNDLEFYKKIQFLVLKNVFNETNFFKIVKQNRTFNNNHQIGFEKQLSEMIAVFNKLSVAKDKPLYVNNDLLTVNLGLNDKNLNLMQYDRLIKTENLLNSFYYHLLDKAMEVLISTKVNDKIDINLNLKNDKKHYNNVDYK